MPRYLLLSWVLAGLVAGVVLLVLGQPVAAGWVWSATALPVAAHVGIGLVRSLLGGSAWMRWRWPPSSAPCCSARRRRRR
jgi:hypothetical protein